jgi:hypothetical protein
MEFYVPHFSRCAVDIWKLVGCALDLAKNGPEGFASPPWFAGFAYTPGSRDPWGLNHAGRQSRKKMHAKAPGGDPRGFWLFAYAASEARK